MSGTGSLEATAGAPVPADAGALEDDERQDAAPAGTDEAAAPPGGAPRWVWWAALAAAVLPFLASAVAVFLGVGGDYHPAADVAGTEMLVRDIGHHEVLLGPFSRDGWHHPGPALFYVLAGPYRLLGSSPEALAAGALLVNALSVVGIAVVARRRGGTPLLLCTLITFGLLVHALGFEFLAMAWNPWITVLPYAFLVMLTWSMTCGERWALPLAVLVATFVVQTHVGYAVLALPLVALGAVWLLVGAAREARARHCSRRGDTAEAGAAGEPAAVASGPEAVAGEPARRPRRWRLAGAVALALVIVLVTWWPPVAQQLNNEPGNLGVIVRWFGERGEDARDLVDGWRVVSAQYGIWPEWLAGQGPKTIVDQPLYIDQPLFPFLLVLVALAAVAGWRRPGGDARRLVVVWLVASVLGVVAVARTVGILYAYRLNWAWPLGAIAGVLCLWVGWSWFAARFPGAERRLLPAAALGLAVVTAVDVVAAVRAGTPQQEESAMLDELGDEVSAALPPDAGPLRVVPTSFLAIGYGNGLMAELERRGLDPRWALSDPWEKDHREPPRHPWGLLLVVTDTGLPSAWDDPELEVLAYSSDLSPDELRERVTRLRRAEARLETSQRGADAEAEATAFKEVADAILPHGTATGVFLAPSEPTPAAVAPNQVG